ncbi:TPA: ead/Ea22-like family protein [Enterobacter asburiae]
MSNIDKRALREAAERAGQNDWEYVYTSDLSAPGRGYITVGGAEAIYCLNKAAGGVKQSENVLRYIAAANPATVLALLDELEWKDALIAEQDKRLVDYAAIATKSAGRVAALEKKTAFLKERLAQLANFNPDWDMLEAATDSLREHMSELTAANKRIAELEARTVTVRLPERKGDSDGSSTSEFDYGWNASAAYRDEQWKTALTKAGINLTVEG